MRIFIVDDSPTASLLLQRNLEELGHEVGHAQNGREAWDQLQKNPERLVITDWMMPEMNGVELCRKIRSVASTSYTYVIMITVKDLRKDRFEGLEAGADDFLTKPIDAIELATALNTARRILSAQTDLQRRVAELEQEYAPAAARSEG